MTKRKLKHLSAAHHRLTAKYTFDELKELISEPDRAKMFSGLDKLLESVFEKRRGKNERIFRTAYHGEVGSIQVGILSLTLLIRFFEENTPVSSEWTRSPKVNPNFVPAVLITNLQQQLVSVIELEKCGLVNPARVLFRSSFETLWMYIVTLFRQDRLAQYQTISEEEFEDKAREKKNWRKYFSHGELLKEFSIIEKEVFESASVRDDQLRKEMYSFYSLSAHPSYQMSVAVAYKETGMPFPAFSRVAVRRSIQQVQAIIYELIFYSNYALKHIHKAKVQESDAWTSYTVVACYFLALYLPPRGRKMNVALFYEKMFKF